MGFFPDAQELINRLMSYAIEEYPGIFALGLYFAIMIALGVAALVLLLMLAAITLPFRVCIRLINWIKRG